MKGLVFSSKAMDGTKRFAGGRLGTLTTPSHRSVVRRIPLASVLSVLSRTPSVESIEINMMSSSRVALLGACVAVCATYAQAATDGGE